MDPVRVLPCEEGEPAWNMALDEALLRASDGPTLRFYTWSPPGLSLGWFQRYDAVASLPGRHVVVRRLTGGGAIYHQRELTFSITGPLRSMPWADPIEAGYVRLHEAIRDALERVGVDSTLAGNRGRAAPRPDELWCFRHPTHADLLGRTGRKLLGSAQRRIRTPEPRILHHGSLVMAAPAYPIEGTASAHEQVPGLEAEPLVRSLTDALAAVMGRRAEPGRPTAAEIALATDLRDRRYRDPKFIRRR